MDTLLGTGDWWSSLVLPLGAGVCLSAACGFRTFLPLLCLGLASRFGIAPLDEQFAWLASTTGLLTLSTAATLEVIGYYIPFVDNALDVIATPLAMAAGTVAMLASLGVVTGVPAWLIALIVGGGVSGAVQVTSVKARAISSGTTGGLANPVMATGELVGAATLSALAIIVPVVAAIVAMVTILVMWRTWRWIRRKGMPSKRIAPG
jgi:hypothetical protein